MSELPWYRRFPDRFIAGTLQLTLEEKGAYSILLDLMYAHGGPIADEARYIAGVCNCSVRKWNAIRARLIETGKIVAENGILFNVQVEEELEIAAKSARERAENGAKGGNKSAEIRATLNKNNALAQAPLKHATSIAIKKETRTRDDPTESVAVDRWKEAELFRACEMERGKECPQSVQRWSFPATVVAKARAILAEKSAGESLH